MFRNVELKLEERVPRETFFRSSTGVYGKKKISLPYFLIVKYILKSSLLFVMQYL